MNFSGSITETNGMTTTRLIERIVEMDRPGRLELKDDPSGRKASIIIRRGMVEDVTFNDQHGDPALAAIGASMPWDFEFHADDAGEVGWSSSIRPRAPRARARAVIRPATPAAGGESPSQPELPTTQPAQPEPEAQPAAAAVPAPAPAPPSVITTPVPTMIRRAVPEDAVFQDWVASGAGHCLHFAWTGQNFLGSDIHADDHAYFREDYAYLRSLAARITYSLGAESPNIVAIAENDRATGYRIVSEGFLGALSGAGSTVDLVIGFGESAPGKAPGTRDLVDLLFAAPEITGMVVHTASHLIHSRMPDGLPEEKASVAASALGQFFQTYQAADRRVNEVFIQTGALGILCVASPRSDKYLTIFLRGRSTAGNIIHAARTWLENQA